MGRYSWGRRIGGSALGLLAALLAAGCQKPPAAAPEAAGSAAAGSAAPAAGAKLAGTLRMVCWNNYVTPAVAADFEREFGIKIHLDLVNNNEEVIARLKKGEVWDVWTPSDYAVQIASEAGLLAPLDHAAIPNLKNVGRRFQNAIYDQKFRFSIPFYWGTTGWGYDTRVFKSPPNTWGYLFDPALRRQVAGKISLLDDMREGMAIALMYLGHDPNSTDPAQLGKARDLLIAAKPAVAAFDSEHYGDNLAADKIELAQGWSGDFAQAAAKDPHLGFALPKEGFMLFVDNLAIPAASRNKEAAQVLINYLLRPEVSAKLTNENRNPMPNSAARPLLHPEILASPSLFLPEDRSFFVIKYLGDKTAVMEKYWRQVQAAR
jgi:spermidine/putrescine-binding protein